MKRSRIIALAAICLAALAFTSCDIIIRIFDTGPDVNLSGPSTLLWGQVGTYDTGLDSGDVADDNLTFIWYLDGIRQTSVSSTATSVTFGQTPDSAASYVISVDVTTGSGRTVSDQITVSVGGPALFRVYNDTPVELYYCYFRTAGTSSWSADMFGDDHVDPYQYSGTYVFQPGSYDFQARSAYTQSFSLYAEDLEEGMITTMTCHGTNPTPSVLPRGELELSGSVHRSLKPVFTAVEK